MENPLAKEFSLLLKGKNPFSKEFPSVATAFSINCLKEKSVYEIAKDFPLSQL